jgi:NAD(P)-dependent dehydrogenase (short-subunit alcohol dehydrogenase family)
MAAKGGEMGQLDGKVAIVTAAGSGMGRASALLFAREGAKVVVDDIDSDKGQEVANQIRRSRGDAIFVGGDVTKLDDLEMIVEVAKATYGRIDVLFNHAGAPGPYRLEDVTESEWQRCIDINTKGAFFLTKFAVPEMRKAGGGAILFTSSMAGLVGSPTSPLYSLVKAGIVNMTRSLALLLAADNIRVNCICPGGVLTPMSSGFLPPVGEEEKQAMLEQWKKTIPLGRWGQPEEVANAALFLVSDQSSFITGVALPIDAGITAR